LTLAFIHELQTASRNAAIQEQKAKARKKYHRDELEKYVAVVHPNGSWYITASVYDAYHSMTELDSASRNSSKSSLSPAESVDQSRTISNIHTERPMSSTSSDATSNPSSPFESEVQCYQYIGRDWSDGPELGEYEVGSNPMDVTLTCMSNTMPLNSTHFPGSG
jgi:hypothetical protein